MTDVPLPPVAQYFLGSCLPGAGCLSSARFRGRRKSTGVKRQSGAADSAPRRGQPTSLDEVAAREANHRIMNNLSVLRSLLQMKRRRLKDENASQILDELVMRLEAMTIVHRQLARGVGQAGIVDAATYLGEFVSELAATMACESYAIRFSAPTSAPLPSCKATLLAQLTSELVINAYKHAFEGQETGEIRVTLERGDAGFRLVVADNCIGLPEHFDPEASDGIGMRLISGFAAQIGGELHIVTGDPGASFAVTFPG